MIALNQVNLYHAFFAQYGVLVQPQMYACEPLQRE